MRPPGSDPAAFLVFPHRSIHPNHPEPHLKGTTMTLTDSLVTVTPSTPNDIEQEHTMYSSTLTEPRARRSSNRENRTVRDRPARNRPDDWSLAARTATAP